MPITLVLAASVVLQLIAAAVALRAMQHCISPYRYAWLALSLALILMLERRAVPLYNTLQGGAEDPVHALFGLMISALMAFSLIGLERLLCAMRENEDRLTYLATTDVLTGLANRQHLLATLAAELRRAARNGRPLSLLMLDLDHFKAVNDQHGHAIGDTVLRTTAARCTAQLRNIDTCGRLGGEEFVVLLPETGVEEARTTAERLRAVLDEKTIDTDIGPVQVTVSIGLASHDPTKLVAEKPRDGNIEAQTQRLLREADQALYRAKASGRNCVGE